MKSKSGNIWRERNNTKNNLENRFKKCYENYCTALNKTILCGLKVNSLFVSLFAFAKTFNFFFLLILSPISGMAFKASANSVFAILAAVFLTLYSILGALIRFGVVGAPIPHAQDYSSPFDLDYLNMKWAWMRSVFGLSIAADGFGMLGLLCLVFTAHQLRKIYRAHEGVAHRALFYCFLFGGLLPVVEFLQNLGVTGNSFSLFLCLSLAALFSRFAKAWLTG